MTGLGFRDAGVDDAGRIAWLHADSWRRHYRGAFADWFLDGDLETERREVWGSRLSAASGSATIVAEYDGELVGFVHVVMDDDPKWGSLLDNLHVRHDQHRGGIGSQLLARAARAVIDQAAAKSMYLWVLEQNLKAQKFYLASGGIHLETTPVSPPGGDPARLNGTPLSQRMVWSGLSKLTNAGKVPQ